MYNPPHPGEIIREFCVEPLNINVTEAARALGVTRKTFSALLNGRAGISPVAPTVILTEMGEKVWVNNPDKGNPMKAKIPLQRFGRPLEVADLVFFGLLGIRSHNGSNYFD